MPEGGGFSFGPFHLDPHERRLVRNGVPLVLPKAQFKLLVALVSRAGEALSKDELIRAAWNGMIVSDSTLAQAAFRLRGALDADEADRYIETVHGHGYRFAAPVTRADAGAGTRPRADIDALLAPHRAFLNGRAALETLEAARLISARDTFARLVLIDPADASFRVGLATALVLEFEATRADPSPNVDALRQAATHAREACELGPGNAEAWATHGFVLERTGERDDARAALTRAVKIDPLHWLHHLRLAYASWGTPRLVAAQRALDLMPGNPLACVLIATVLVARGALADAEAALEPGLRALASDKSGPSRVSAVALYWLKGLLCLARGEVDAALAALNDELGLEVRGHLYTRECCANTWYAIGACELLSGDHARARASFEQAIVRVPGHSMAHAGLALLTGDRRSPPEAPMTMDGAVARATVFVADGDPASAARLVAAAIAAAPPGNAGWRVPIEPLLGVGRSRSAWEPVLVELRRRAV